MDYLYKAFISYKHGNRDSKVAEELQEILEKYIIPEECRIDGKETLGKIFRDEKDLSYTNDLPEEIKKALDASEFLIVICSPETVKSLYVPGEISYFLEHHPQERIRPVLSAGDPKEVFPAVLPMLKEPFGMELSGYPDQKIRKGIKELLSKLCAPLLGMEPDDLVRRELQWKQKRSTFRWSLALAVVSVIVGILLWSNRTIDAKNDELEQMNQTLVQQNNEILLRESEVLTAEALELLNAGDRYSAMETVLAALPAPGETRPMYAAAAQVLFRSISPFQEESKNFVFRDTVLRQGTAVQNFCINADGKLLTTVDQFNNLTCFDTVTGEQRWKTQVYEKYLYEDALVFFCVRWDCVLFFTKEVIAAVNQQTGELLWIMKPKYAASDMIFLRGEDGVFAYFCQEWSNIETSYILVLCSARTGEEVGRIPIVTVPGSLLESSVWMPRGNDGKHWPGAFSTDGRYFAGCYLTKDKRIYYYLVDTLEMTCREIASEASASAYDKVCRILFAGEDDSLVVIRQHPEKSDHLCIERVQLLDGAILWTQEVEGNVYDGVVCMQRSKSLYFASGKELYYLTLSDGEIPYRVEMYDTVVDLYRLEDGFGYLLQNGQTTAGWIGGNGFVDTQRISSELFDMGSCARGQLWNGGSVRLIVEDSSVTGFTMLSEDNGGGYAAMIPQEDDHTVVIQRPIQLTGLQKLEHTAEFPGDSIFDTQYIGEDTLVLFNISVGQIEEGKYQTLVLDPATLALKASYITEKYCLGDNTLYLPDGSSRLKTDYKTITHYDLKTGTASDLIDGYYPTLQIGENQVNTYLLEVSSCRLSENGDVLSAAATEHGIRLWCNGEHLRDVLYPRQILGSDKWFSGVGLHTGANDMVLVSSLSEDGTRLFLVYDVSADCWYEIPTELPFAENFALICGSEAPFFLILDNTGTAYLYDIPTQSLRIAFSTETPQTALINMQMCMDDAYVVVYSNDKDVRIFDLASGEVVFFDRLPWTNSEPLRCCYDPENNRLYLASYDSYETGFCLATDTWFVLTAIPNLLCCNENDGRILQAWSDYKNQKMEIQMQISALPMTEELIEYGHAILGE